MVFPRWHDSQPDKREFFIVTFCVIIYACLRFVLALQGFLHPDEAYYWVWSLNPDWAYYDQGPGIAWYIKAFTFLFGHTYFALKLAAVSALIPVLLCVYFSARELGLGPVRSSIAIIGLALCPGVFAGSEIIVHDTVLLIFWSLALYFMIRYLRKRELISFYFVFLCLGLGALSKHSMGGFALGLIFWLLTQKSEFYILKSRHLWLGCLLSIICLFPVLYWNYQNDWDQIGAIVNLRSSGGTFAKGNSVEMILGQIGLISPFWFLAFTGLVGMIFFKNLRKFSFIKWRPDTREISWYDYIQLYCNKARLSLVNYYSRARWKFDHSRLNPAETELNRKSAFWMIFWNAIVLFLFFAILSRSRNIQANWLIPSYPAVFILLAAYIPVGSLAKNPIRPILKKIYICFLLLGFVPVLFMNVYPFYGHKMISLVSKDIPPGILIQYRTAGYRQMIANIDKLRQRVDPNAKIVANRYQDAAIAHWYLPDHEYVASINIAQKNQYSYWPSMKKGKNYFLFVSRNDTTMETDPGLPLWLELMFEKVEEFPSETIQYNGYPVKKYKVYYAQNLKVHWYEVLALYLDRIAILQFMPSMRGYDKGLKKSINNSGTKKIMSLMHRNKECSQKKGIDRIAEFLSGASKKTNCR